MRRAGFRLAILAGLLALAACGRPVDPDEISEPDEIPPGRGVFTGDDGEFSTGI